MTKPAICWTHGDLVFPSKGFTDLNDYKVKFYSLVNSLRKDENLDFYLESRYWEGNLHTFVVLVKISNGKGVLIRSDADNGNAHHGDADNGVSLFRDYVCRTYEAEHPEMVNLLKSINGTYTLRCVFQEFMYKLVKGKCDFVDCGGGVSLNEN